MKNTLMIFLFLVLAYLPVIGQESSKQAPTAEDRTKQFVDHMSSKLSLTKGQKDTLNGIFLQFIDDLQKYHAESNAKVVTFLIQSRDGKVKKLLRDSLKYEKYLLQIEEMKKQEDPQRQAPPQNRGGGMHNRSGGMGGGRPY